VADPVQFDWASKLWEAGQLAVGALLTAASSVVLWFGRKGIKSLRILNRLRGSVADIEIKLKEYDEKWAMVNRHDELLKQANNELGESLKHRTNCNKGPMGEALTKELDGLKGGLKVVHRRVTIRRKENAKLREDLRELKADIKWLCKKGGREDDGK
jgi:hypothetical protein